MKKSFKYIVMLLVTGGMFSGCLPDSEEERLSYSGPTLVEFKNHTVGMQNNAPTGLDFRGILSTTTTGQTDSSRFISLVGYNASTSRTVRPVVTDTIYVQLVGPHRGTATEVNFEVMASSTAVEGTDYTLSPVGARKVTIPANSSVGYILINPIASAFTGTARRTVGFRLLGAPDAAPNPNYDTFYVTMTRTF